MNNNSDYSTVDKGKISSAQPMLNKENCLMIYVKSVSIIQTDKQTLPKLSKFLMTDSTVSNPIKQKTEIKSQEQY